VDERTKIEKMIPSHFHQWQWKNICGYETTESKHWNEKWEDWDKQWH